MLSVSLFSEMFSFLLNVAPGCYGDTSILPDEAEGGCVCSRHSSQYTTGLLCHCGKH